MDRKSVMIAAKHNITNAMAKYELTAMEWIKVLHELAQEMIQHGLTEEWNSKN